jgi:hypothetical protein
MYLVIHARALVTRAYTWKACCITAGFLHEKVCPSLETYPGVLDGFEGRGAWKSGEVQYEGCAGPEAVAECSRPGDVITQCSRSQYISHLHTSSHCARKNVT